jgi:hypothetical protein
MKSGLVAVLRFFSVWSRAQVSLASSKVTLPLERLVQQHTGVKRPLFAFVVDIGNYRKLIAQAMTEDGDVLGYIKIPLVEAALARVQHESRILTLLQDHPELNRSIPRPLFAGPWASKFVLFTTPGPRKPVPLEFGRSHAKLLRAIHSVRAERRRGVVIVNEVRTRWDKTASAANALLRTSADRALRLAARGLAGEMLECGLSHGDFVPWNLSALNGRLFAFDWEAARFGVPCAWDYFHYQVQSEVVLGKPLSHFPALSAVDLASFLLFLVDSIRQSLEEDNHGSAARDIRIKRRILTREMRKAEKTLRVA